MYTLCRDGVALAWPRRVIACGQRTYIYKQAVHTQIHDFFFCAPVPSVIVDRQFVAALLHLLGLFWYVMPVSASKLVPISRFATQELRLIKPSNLGQLAAKLEGPITN